MKLSYLFFILISVFGTNCQSQKNLKGFRISGTIPDASNMEAQLDLLGDRNTATLKGKSPINDKGEFLIKSDTPLTAGIYKLTIGKKAAPIIVDGKENDITINGNLSSFDTMTFKVTGSKGTQEFASLVQKLVQKQNNPETVIAAIRSATNPYAAMQIAFVGLPQTKSNIAIHKEIANRIKTLDPNSSYLASYENAIKQMDAMGVPENGQAKQEGPISIGMQAPDIALPNPTGKTMALSDLKGKVVLLDFWASWCGPCRQANPHVVEIYNKYKDKGFTVFSVSLDGVNPRQAANMDAQMLATQTESAKQRWITAIQQDNLTWNTHVSDLKHWGSNAAQLYGVNSIPRTFLLDAQGKIIAINPRTNLEEEVKKALKI